MYFNNPLVKRVVKALNNTHRSLRDVCEDLDLDYDDVAATELPIDRCSHCGVWSTKLVPDLDDNPICPVCVVTVGL